jgi:hypothetical protein
MNAAPENPHTRGRRHRTSRNVRHRLIVARAFDGNRAVDNRRTRNAFEDMIGYNRLATRIQRLCKSSTLCATHRHYSGIYFL